MTRRPRLKQIAVGAALAIAAGTASAGSEVMETDDLNRWTTSLTHIRDMTPGWAVQGADAFKTSSDAGVPVVYLDVRKPEEWAKGTVEGATLVRLTDLATQAGIARLPEDKSAIIAVYCKSGHRSALAIPLLHQLGYANAISMKGGYEAWVDAGYPVSAGPAE